jgi:hypothetical protein
MHLDQQLGIEDVFGENGFSGFRSPDFRPKFVPAGLPTDSWYTDISVKTTYTAM